MRRVFYTLVLLMIALPVFGEYRSFDTLFPDCGADIRERIFSDGGIMETSERESTARLLPAFLEEMDFPQPVLSAKPAFLVETLMVIPAESLPPNGADIPSIYNALHQARNLKGRLYISFTRGNKETPLFEEATQIAIGTMKEIPDPPLNSPVKESDRIFIKLKDVNFGASYYRADITTTGGGIICGLSNFRNLNYLFVPVIRANKFVAQLYFEPLTEGLLVYCVAGADVSDFIASRINIPSALSKRLNVIIGWVIDGIRGG